MLRFACRGCGHKMKVPPEYAGKKVRCGGCKQPLRVPTPKPASDTPASTSASKPTRSKPRRKPASAGGGKNSSASKSGMAMLDRSDGGLSGLDKAGRSGGGISLADLAAMEAAAPVGARQHDGRATAPPGQKACESCGKFCPDEAKLCVQCGYQFGSGKQLQTKKLKANVVSSKGGKQKAEPAGSFSLFHWRLMISGLAFLALGVMVLFFNVNPGNPDGDAFVRTLDRIYQGGGKWLVGLGFMAFGAMMLHFGWKGKSSA